MLPIYTNAAGLLVIEKSSFLYCKAKSPSFLTISQQGFCKKNMGSEAKRDLRTLGGPTKRKKSLRQLVLIMQNRAVRRMYTK